MILCNKKIFEKVFFKNQKIFLKMVYDIFCVEEDIAYEEFIKDCVLKLYDDFNILIIYSECYYYNIRIIDGYEQDIMFDNLE